MNLFDLSEAYLTLLDLDIDEEDLRVHLENIDGEIEDKADNYAYIIRTLEGQADTIKKEEERLAAKRRAITNRVKYLKVSLEEAMILLDKRKFKTDLNSFYIQKNRASVHIIDEDKIPEDYFKIERKPIKADIEEALKQGLLTDCAELVQTESLRIR